MRWRAATFADTSLYTIPEGVTDEQGVFISDIIPTGYEIGVRDGGGHAPADPPTHQGRWHPGSRQCLTPDAGNPPPGATTTAPDLEGPGPLR